MTHALAHRNLDAAGKEQLGDFDAGSVDLSSVTAGASYLGGWTLASGPEIQMFEQHKVRSQLTIRVHFIIFLCIFTDLTVPPIKYIFGARTA